MNLNTTYVGFSLEEQRLLRARDGQLVAVRGVDPTLADLLPEWDSLGRVLQHLDKATDADLLVKESQESRRLWQDAGLFYKFTGRIHDAIAIFYRLYEEFVNTSREARAGCRRACH